MTERETKEVAVDPADTVDVAVDQAKERAFWLDLKTQELQLNNQRVLHACSDHL